MALSWYVSEDGVWDQKGDQHFIERGLGGRDVSLNSFLVRADDEYVENYNQAKRNNQSSGSLRRTKGTMANPSPGEHVGPCSSAATGDVMPWKSTVYIMSHILPGFTITDSVPFPQGQELAIGVLRSLGEGRGCGLTYMMCQRIEAGNPNAGLATNVTFHALQTSGLLGIVFLPVFSSVFFLTLPLSPAGSLPLSLLFSLCPLCLQSLFYIAPSNLLIQK